MADIEYAEMDVAAWSRRSDVELLSDQLAAIEAWHRARRMSEQADATAGLSREMRLDLRQRMDSRRRTQAALLARAADQLREGEHLLRTRAPTRAVLVHRNQWLRAKVEAGLTVRGVQVVAQLDCGPDAVGVVVVEQPDVLLIEAALPLMTGLEVLRATRRYAPRTLVGAQLNESNGSAELLAAGAAVTFSRRVTPGDIAQELAALVG